MNLIDEQIAIECNAHHEAKARYIKYKMKQDTSFAKSAISSNLLSHVVPIYADQIDKWIEKQPRKVAYNDERTFLREIALDSVSISIATLRTIFTEVFQKKQVPINNIAYHIYTAIHIENAYEEFKDYGKSSDISEEEKRDWKSLSRKLIDDTKNRRFRDKCRVLQYARDSFTDLSTIEPKDKIKLGIGLIYVALTLQLKINGYEHPVKLLKMFNSRRKGKTYHILAFSDEVKEYLSRVENQMGSVLFSYYPMVVPPTDWEGMFGGGYVTPRGRGNLPLIKSPNIRLYNDSDIGPEVLKAVNIIQKTPWQINKEVFAVMQYCSDNGLDIGGLPVKTKDVLLPPKLDDEVWAALSQQQKSEVINERKALHRELDSNSSKLLSLKLKISMARRFLKYERIYFPHTFDFRGRVYPIASAVNPHSDKYGQALLRFAEGKEIGKSGRKWLAIHGANCFGLDSESFDLRLKWIEENSQNISATAENPLGEREFWGAADDAFGFLAFCCEWAEMLKMEDQTKFVSKLPIKLDATSSGLQHYSAIFRDEIGAIATNLTGDERSDIYKLVAEKTYTLIEADLVKIKDPEEKVWKRSLLECLNRDICKPATMCLPYGISLFGATDALLEKFEDGKLQSPHLDNVTNRERTKRLRYLASKIMIGVGAVVKSAIVGMDWIKKAEKMALLNSEDKPLRFRTKLGFPFINQYYKTTKKKYYLYLSTERISFNTQSYTRQIDKRKSNTAIAPNFIHSQDATHLLKTALLSYENGIESFSFIHDSFGTHAADTEKFRQIIRDAFIWLYEGDTLKEAKRQWAKQFATKDIPEPPYEEYGSMDIQECKESDYMFN